MVLFAMISRVSDGMPLSASTDLDMHFEIKESKRQAKIVAKRANQYPIKCWTKSGGHVIYLVKAVGVCFLAVCEAGTYPTVLAYSFLDEIQREFMVSYQSQDVQRAKRPYSFIEFDSFIQKTKQRYNNTRSLTTRINLSEMHEELQNSPPHEIDQLELAPVDLSFDVKTYKTGGPVSTLKPITWIGMTTCGLSALCGLLNFIRCLPFLSLVGVNDEVAESPTYSAIAFFLACLLNCTQCYLLIFHTRWRLAVSSTVTVLLLILIYYLKTLRNFWQILFHTSVTLVALYQTTARQLREKPPGYNV